MQITVKLTQEDIETIILDFYKKQGATKESVQFYQTAVDKDDSEIYAIVSEKENLLKIIEPQSNWIPDNLTILE